ncbi:MAG TPA: transporter substrate-binding domain-containing protein, partial [Pseudobdellovibrionaceae bacterium]|nr:transporter substrate-binding domain-containing protein [Pseudobdellovibrionaceae bacterium]
LPIIGLRDEKPTGILVDELTKLGKKINVEFKFELFPWARALEKSKDGSGGIIGVSKTSEREQVFDYSEPIYVDSIIAVVMKGREISFRTLEDFNGKRIGVQIGASYGEEVDRYLASGKAIVDRDVDRVNRIVKLLNNRIDVAFIGNGHKGLKQIIENKSFKDSGKKLIVLPKRIQEDPLYLAFAKKANKTELIKKINQEIRKNHQKSVY